MSISQYRFTKNGKVFHMSAPEFELGANRIVCTGVLHFDEIDDLEYQTTYRKLKPVITVIGTAFSVSNAFTNMLDQIPKKIDVYLKEQDDLLNSGEVDHV